MVNIMSNEGYSKVRRRAYLGITQSGEVWNQHEGSCFPPRESLKSLFPVIKLTYSFDAGEERPLNSAPSVGGKPISHEDAVRMGSKIARTIKQGLERLKPCLKVITEANATTKEELDEDALVDKLLPLIDEASAIVNEVLGRTKGMDLTGEYTNRAQRNYADHKATPEEQK
ncbi:hypothetical protein BDZ91DRAFT_850293 [Kalaharituber pfeilii]|nr:hypothetical protein BDZ91DRAFT_850293 [Kalaharituber pfeilii]